MTMVHVYLSCLFLCKILRDSSISTTSTATISAITTSVTTTNNNSILIECLKQAKKEYNNRFY